MNILSPHSFNATVCRKELVEYRSLLSTHATLEEQQEILPFFKSRHDISTLIAEYFPDVRTPNIVDHEYRIQGQFIADLVVGDTAREQYLLVEFENGYSDSIFKKIGKKQTLEWAPRFEHGFSQLVDWLWLLEDMRGTDDFIEVFGSNKARFHGLLILGKGVKHSKREVRRLEWRMDRVVIDSHKLSCVTFDQLYEDLDFWLTKIHGK